MFIYVVLSIILSLLILCACIKIKYRFWTLLPFHRVYDISSRIKSPFSIIDDTETRMNKYTNIINITTNNAMECSENERNKIARFIKRYCFSNKFFNCNITTNNIFPYLEGSNIPGFISIYSIPFLLEDNNTIDSTEEYKGLITSRCLTMSITKCNRKNIAVYYFDFMTLHPLHKPEDTAHSLIQTHIFNMCKKKSNIKYYLLKHFSKPKIVKSLTSFHLYGYSLKNIPVKLLPNASFQLINLTQHHGSFLKEFLDNQLTTMDCIIMPELTNLFGLIKTNNIILQGVKKNNKLISLYIFKNTNTNYSYFANKKDKVSTSNTLICIGSLFTKEHKKIFISGFSLALDYCFKNLSTKYIFVETISENHHLVDFLDKTSHKIYSKKGDYILYNCTIAKVPSNKCFFLN